MNSAISKKEYEAAMEVVCAYCEQQERLAAQKNKVMSPHQVGCRVRLSSFGIEMQGSRKKNWKGTIISFSSWMGRDSDGSVMVKWDGRTKAESMHISQVETIKST